jgi:dihydroorotate dehydrogenase electron transfer subunit
VPGQFVSITLEPPWEENSSGDAGVALLRRPFGVASLGEDSGRPLLGILYASLGKVTRRMRALSPGSRIGVLGPLGVGFPGEDLQPRILVAGGRGIGPLLFLAQVLSRRHQPFSLLYGTRTADEMIRLPEFPGGRVLLATDDGSRGEKGTAGDLLRNLNPPVPPMVVACGPRPMLEAVALQAQERAWQCWVSVEEMFGCGLGLCGSCAVPAADASGAYERFLWACRDGPVFRAECIDWDAWKRGSE